MKVLEYIEIHGKCLSVLAIEKETNKAYISYFIDGVEITQWETLPTLYKNLFTVLSDALCEGMKWQKWSY